MKATMNEATGLVTVEMTPNQFVTIAHSAYLRLMSGRDSRTGEHIFISDFCQHQAHEACRAEQGDAADGFRVANTCSVCGIPCMCECHNR